MKTVKDTPPKSLLEAWRERQHQAARLERKQRGRRRHLVNHDELLRVFGKPLEQLRHRSGLTMLEAGIKSRTSDNTVWRIESGENTMLYSVLALARSYGYRVELTFHELEAPP